MPSDRFFHDEGTLTVTVNGTDITAAEARGITVTPQAEHNRFYGPDDIQFQDVKRSQFQVGVDIEIAEMNEDFVQWWLDGSATPAAVGTATQSTAINNTNDVAQFNVTAEQPMTSGDYKLKNVVHDVDFPELPALDTTEGEYEARSITGTGKGIVHTNESV